MPRLSPALIRQARSENPLLPLLIRVCRDLPSARNELRWLREHARHIVQARRHASNTHALTSAAAIYEKQSSRNSVVASSEPQETIVQGLLPQQASGTKKNNDQAPPTASHKTDLKQTGSKKKIAALAKPKIVPESEPSSSGNPSEPSVKITRHKFPLRIKHQHSSRSGLQSSRSKIHQKPLPARWTRNRYSQLVPRRGRNTKSALTASAEDDEVEKQVARSVTRRSEGVPLQYVVGDQPFGNLEVLCEPGALIPRAETETYTSNVGKLLATAMSREPPIGAGRQTWLGRGKFRILDLCTGTGCIALLLHSILKPVDGTSALPPGVGIEILGVDKVEKVVKLARKNLKHNVKKKLLHPDALHDVTFKQLDLLGLPEYVEGSSRHKYDIRTQFNALAGVQHLMGSLRGVSQTEGWDVVIANPPYVSQKDYEVGGKTEPSVRNHEPKEALVPPTAAASAISQDQLADSFYLPIFRIAKAVMAQLLVLEVGDSAQALRVGKILRTMEKPKIRFMRLETWKDDEAVRIHSAKHYEAFTHPPETMSADPNPEISDRAVVVWSGALGRWRLHEKPEPGPSPARPDYPWTGLKMTKPQPERSRRKAAKPEPSLPRIRKIGIPHISITYAGPYEPPTLRPEQSSKDPVTDPSGR
jgi:HemK-like putative methylase